MAKAYSLIQAQTLTGSAASVTFSNIPQNYTDLKLVCSTRTATAAVGDGVYLMLSGTLTAKRLQGNGASATSDTDYYGAWNTGANATASTFGSTEFYIPNYTSSNAKSFSSDSVSENNATTAYASMIAHLSSSTSAISTITLGTESGAVFAIGSTFYLYGIGGTRATGGTITSDANYTYHTFTSTGVLTALEQIKNAEVLTVAGGGGGGYNSTSTGRGGGGGAGGVTYSAGQLLQAGTSFSAIVGAGGATAGPAANGTNSYFSAFNAAIGGGGGGSGPANSNRDGKSGGSGGGGATYGGSTTAGSGTSGQGYAGGTGTEGAPDYGSGGGGGAGGVGINGIVTKGGNGGIGTNAYTTWHSATNTGVASNNTYYIAGGGGGAVYSNSYAIGIGGLGGGGNGASDGQGGTAISSTAATANTGGGGGAGTDNRVGTAGASGLVIVRYPNT
jgi:hypothetical protein